MNAQEYQAFDELWHAADSVRCRIEFSAKKWGLGSELGRLYRALAEARQELERYTQSLPQKNEPTTPSHP